MTQSPSIASMIRVNQAGEYGASYIYKGQLKALAGSSKKELIQMMHDQEQVHLEAFNHMLVERRVRPTALSPLWKMAGFSLGYITGKLGEEAAMACTVAVEEVIDEHYKEQEDELTLRGDEPALLETITRFRQDELEHKEIGLEHGAEQAIAYGPLTMAVKTASRIAIWLSKKI